MKPVKKKIEGRCLDCIEYKSKRLGQVLDYMEKPSYCFSLFTGPKVVSGELDLIQSYQCPHVKTLLEESEDK